MGKLAYRKIIENRDKNQWDAYLQRASYNEKLVICGYTYSMKRTNCLMCEGTGIRVHICINFNTQIYRREMVLEDRNFDPLHIKVGNDFLFR